jgi:2-polyprenyl-3-methyl-5-hydroxy-6-metoxy-1,4-benzoquinol methylase
VNGSSFPLDLDSEYAYLERPHRALLSLLETHVLARVGAPRILDIGCGCGANARAVRTQSPQARLVGLEPDTRAVARADRSAFDILFPGDVDAWIASRPTESFDAVVLSDVLEHVRDPVRFLKTLRTMEGVRDAVWLFSVPNFAVWYNRIGTLLGRFEYASSGLYDRTHVRFYTRKSLKDLLAYAGYRILETRCSASLLQAAAPWLRPFFEADIERGDNLALGSSRAYRVYSRLIEPLETRLCGLWPSLLGFQIVIAAAIKPVAGP